MGKCQRNQAYDLNKYPLMLSPSTGLKGCQRVNQVRGQNKLNIPLSKCIKRKPEAPGKKKGNYRPTAAEYERCSPIKAAKGLLPVGIFGTWKQRNGKVFENITPEEEGWFRSIKQDILLHLCRMNESLSPSILSWLQQL